MKSVGLGSQATLAKIDKLRELNVGSVVPLPQVLFSLLALASLTDLPWMKLVVVGDQSSGTDVVHLAKTSSRSR